MTTFGLKAECGRFIQYDDAHCDLPALLRKGVFDGKFMHLGGGSNLLFTTGHYDGTVLHNASAEYSFSEDRATGDVLLKADAGCVLDELCRISCEHSLWGLENLSGIPGQLGGAAVQNVGAYGMELKDVAVSVEIFDILSGEFRTIPGEECDYGYRNSMFKHLDIPGSMIVTGMEIRFTKVTSARLGYAALKQQFSDTPAENLTPLILREAVIKLRDEKLPAPSVTGSAGSFFMNPIVSREQHAAMQRKHGMEIPGHATASDSIKLSAAWLIDHSGCKPLTSGGAALWQKQPLVLVNATGYATGMDVVNLERAIQHRVHEQFGVWLTPETVHID